MKGMEGPSAHQAQAGVHITDGRPCMGLQGRQVLTQSMQLNVGTMRALLHDTCSQPSWPLHMLRLVTDWACAHGQVVQMVQLAHTRVHQLGLGPGQDAPASLRP